MHIMCVSSCDFSKYKQALSFRRDTLEERKIFMLKKPTPKKLSATEVSNIVAASAAQTAKRTVQKSYDPENFPVFDIPVNGKVLVYVPNHTVTSPEGGIVLRADKFVAHNVLDGRLSAKVRCTQGIVSEELGLDGSCPFCDASAEAWELYNIEYRQLCKSKLLDPEADGTYEAVKTEAQAIRDKKAIGSTAVYYTFPIVVFECNKKPDGSMTTTPATNEAGELIYKICWYTVSEKYYLDKWIKALDGLTNDDDTDVECPAGRWFILNYEYESENGKHDKMHSAQNLAVIHKQMSEKWADVQANLDTLTEEWTPEKAMNVLVDNALRSGDEQAEACADIMKSTREKLAQIKLAGGVPAIPTATSTEAALASFGGAPAIGTSAPTATNQGIADDDIPTVPQAPIA